MGYIGNEPTTGHFPVDNFTSSGGSTYTLSKAPATAGAIEVSVQGVMQSTTAYTVSGTTLTMAGVTSGVKIFVRHLGETLSLPTPADGSVTTAKLGTNSVDGTKIAMGSDAAGDILYHGATDYTRLAKGTAAQQLRMNSGATAPEWATISTPAGGMHTQIGSTQTLSGQSYCNFESGIDSTYKTYLIRFENVTVNTNGANVQLQVGTGGTPTYQTGSVYQFHGQRMQGSSATLAEYNLDSTTTMYVTDSGIGNTSEQSAHFSIYIYNPASAATRTLIRSIGMAYYYGQYDHHHMTGGAYKVATAVTAIRLFPTSGTFSGTFKLYGLS